MTRILASLLIAGAVATPAGLTGQKTPREVTRAVADHYLALTMDQEYDALLDVYADSAVFFDPTGDVFQGPVAEGPVRGAATIVALQKSWGIADAEFDVEAAFAVGHYALYRGTYNLRYGDSQPWIAIPFVTVLRVDAQRISERTDFGDYIEAFSLGDRYDATTERTRQVANEYLEAYLASDLEAERRLLAPDAVAQDPTAQVYGPGSGQPLEGAERILATRARTFQNVTDFDMEVSRSFVANHHAVFMGRTSYTLGNGAHYVQPAVFVVEVRDGKVTRHWDFVDYSVGPVG